MNTPPTCPVFHRKPGRSAALGWSASASVVALALSGLAALAMSAAPTGESLGEEAVQVLLLPSAPAIAAQNEPAPEVAASAPSAPEPPAEDDTAPDLNPAEVAAPDRPVEAPALPGLASDTVAKTDTLPPSEPAELAEADTPVKPKEKPKADAPVSKTPKADTPPVDTPKVKKSKPASADAASGAPAPKSAAAESAGTGARAVANYGSAVMKKIRKTKKQRAPAKGTVIVGFAISETGGLASVKVLKGSGSAELDQVALDHIRRAAPFPPPPPGADRMFSFEFVGKG